MSGVARSVVAMEIVEVSAAAAGVPVSFVREGRTWLVGAVPVRWFERVDWWKTAQRLARDQMYHIDIEVWQVQALDEHWNSIRR